LIPPLLVAQEPVKRASYTGKVMTRDEFVGELIGQAKKNWTQYWASLPDEQRLRLSGMEEELGAISRQVLVGLWQLLGESLDALAIEVAGHCAAGCRRERRKDSISMDVLGHRVELPCTYFYCRRCHHGESPVRKWLGVESGGVTLGFERALTDLTTRMTFGDAVTSMQEHHEQEVDRTKAERVTYAVACDAETYLAERRQQAKERLHACEHEGVEQLVFTADGGAVPVGALQRPKGAKGPRTQVRKLAKGTRVIAGREARFISVHAADSKANRVVDCHIAPYDTPAFTGARMFAAAVEAGLTEESRIHGVFDMGKWIHTQFEEQFFAYEHSACADIMHVAEYLTDAGRVLVGEEKALPWGMEHKRRMLAGEFEKVLAKLTGHQCGPDCTKSESGKCLVRVAQTYLTNNRPFMTEYVEFMIRNLPVGSGEAESGIRHIIKRRMAIAGAWDEKNASLLLSLLTIRASGWWDGFWKWRSERDKKAWRARQASSEKVVFRNKRGRGAAHAKAA
jgi:hypothetical protein